MESVGVSRRQGAEGCAQSAARGERLRSVSRKGRIYPFLVKIADIGKGFRDTNSTKKLLHWKRFGKPQFKQLRKEAPPLRLLPAVNRKATFRRR